MIIKFHARGTGGGKGPVQYLLGRDGQREGSTLLRGDPEQVAELIDSSRYAKKYTSGVLSFAEADLSAQQKRALMDSFEQALLPGLEVRQYSCLWVEHRDKGRLELNFVIPNLELTAGKRLQPFYAPADQRRVDAWMTLQNAELRLADPKDPARKRALVTANNLPRERQEAAQQITNGLLAIAAKGEIRNRSDVIEKLAGAGFQVVRETKSSISIADPDGGKNIRLKGALYERNFKFGPELRGEIEAASRWYRAEREQRIQEARRELAHGVEIKRAELARRHPSPREEPERPFKRNGAEHPSPRAIELEMGFADRSRTVSARRRDALVDGPDISQQLRRDTATERDVGRFEETDMGPHASNDPRRNKVHSPAQRDRGRIGLDGGQTVSSEGVGLDHDRDRARVAERLRRLAAAARAAAERVGRDLENYASRIRAGLQAMGRDCQQLTEAVREHTEREQGPQAAGRQLEQASRRLGAADRELKPSVEKVIKEYEKQYSRSGPSMG